MKIILVLLITSNIGLAGVSLAEPTPRQDPSVVVSRLWEYDRDEFNRMVHLSKTDVEAYLSKVRPESEQLRGVSLLLALNCQLPSGNFAYKRLQDYRCGSLSLNTLINWVTIEGGDIYVLSFAKNADRKRAIEFMRSYVQFLHGQGIAHESNGEYLEEIIQYLESGGFEDIGGTR